MTESLAAMNSSLCKLDNLSFAYEQKKVLTDFSLEIFAGEFIALAGPNGSGKSTLLRIIAGLCNNFSGRLYLGGSKSSALSLKEKARQIAYVPQLLQENIFFSVRQMVSFGRSPWLNYFGGMSTLDEQLIADAMGKADLTALADRPLAQLSGGERQRVALAMAFCREPKLFLLDEPTSALDYEHQLNFMELLKDFCLKTQAAVLIVSHDLNLAAMYAKRFILMADGRLLADGSPELVLTEENMRLLYNCNMLIDQNPCTKTTRLSLLPQTPAFLAAL